MHPAMIQAAALGISFLSSFGGMAIVRYKQVRGSWYKKWRKRRFNGHPAANLRNIAQESSCYKGMEVRMAVRLQFEGCYGVWWESMPYGMRTRKGDGGYVGPLKLEGPLERVLEDLFTWVTDTDTGLMRWDKNRGEDRSKVWKDLDSPIIFEVNLSVRGRVPRRRPNPVVIDMEPEPKQITEQPVPKHATVTELMEAVHAALEAEGIEGDVDVSKRRQIADKAKKYLQGLG